MDLVEDCSVETEEQDLSTTTPFLQTHQNQVIDLKQQFEHDCNLLPIFGFNSAKYDSILMTSYLLPILVNEGDLEPTVKMSDNSFISFKFSDSQLLDILNFLDGATNFDSFLKDFKTNDTKRFPL